MFNLENDREYKLTPLGALSIVLKDVEGMPEDTVIDMIREAKEIILGLSDLGFRIVSEDEL